mgnify:CR=1 FL=1
MISFKDFESSFKNVISPFEKVEIQFGKIINEQLFDNSVDHIEKIIGLIKHKQIPHEYTVSNIYHEPGYYYLVHSNGESHTFKKSFYSHKFDLHSKPDLRITVNQDTHIDYPFDKNKKYNQIIQTQNISFIISEHIKLNLTYSCFDKENQKYNLKLETTRLKEEDLTQIYDLIEYIFPQKD